MKSFDCFMQFGQKYIKRSDSFQAKLIQSLNLFRENSHQAKGDKSKNKKKDASREQLYV